MPQECFGPLFRSDSDNLISNAAYNTEFGVGTGVDTPLISRLDLSQRAWKNKILSNNSVSNVHKVNRLAT